MKQDTKKKKKYYINTRYVRTNFSDENDIYIFTFYLFVYLFYFYCKEFAKENISNEKSKKNQSIIIIRNSTAMEME